MGRNEDKYLCPGVPAGAEAVMINLAAISPSSGGWLAAYPGPARPYVSNLNYTSADVSNAAVVPLDGNGCFHVYNGDTGASTHVLVDVNGYFSPSTGSKIVPVVPMSTSNSLSVTIPPNTSGQFSIRNAYGANGPISGGISGGVVVLDEIGTWGWGFLSAYAGGSDPNYGSHPQASHMNYVSGPQTNTQFLITDYGYYNLYSYARVTMKQTLTAYFTDTAPANQGYTEVYTPARVYDTRLGYGGQYWTTGSGSRVTDVRRVKLTGIDTIPPSVNPGVPGGGIAAVIANVTVTGISGSGTLSAGNGNGELSTLTFSAASGDKANLAIIPVDDQGYGNISVKGGSTHVIIDVVGTISGDSWLNGSNEGTSSGSNGWGEWHCGITSCSFYMTRSKTRYFANFSGDASLVLSSALSSYLIATPWGVNTAIVLSMLDGAMQGISTIAGEVASDNKCLKITVGPNSHLVPIWLAGRNGPYCKD